MYINVGSVNSTFLWTETSHWPSSCLWWQWQCFMCWSMLLTIPWCLRTSCSCLKPWPWLVDKIPNRRTAHHQCEIIHNEVRLHLLCFLIADFCQPRHQEHVLIDTCPGVGLLPWGSEWWILWSAEVFLMEFPSPAVTYISPSHLNRLYCYATQLCF